ncbi:disintegrin and metalloproteinase domain-containing protein 10 [Caerostris extrusa]|uniref:Disintegrin and metalloproteinase domain-containing protein 10 n=1 Tax=Caerostris extrusa TaxID=172846 RepID=A0AAV4VS85_CAEEX|nr:disintegrin and metalloproteinase domain-containing protein 10 [Caerostris extrusa]
MKNISGIKLRPGLHVMTSKTLKTIKQWVTSCWWGVLLSVVAFAIVMGIFIKCCAVHTPSSNPRRAPALRITDTLRHPADTLRRKRHRHQQPPPGPPPPYPGPRPSSTSSTWAFYCWPISWLW